MERVLVDRSPGKDQPDGGRSGSRRLLLGLGVALAAVGWTDVASGWFPADLGSLEWEFGAISGTFDSLPLGTLGLGLMAYAVLLAGTRRSLAILSSLHGVVALGLVALLALYGLDVPVALGGVPDAVAPTLRLAIVKTLAQAVVYVAWYAWAAARLWRDRPRA